MILNENLNQSQKINESSSSDGSKLKKMLKSLPLNQIDQFARVVSGLQNTIKFSDESIEIDGYIISDAQKFLSDYSKKLQAIAKEIIDLGIGTY